MDRSNTNGASMNSQQPMTKGFAIPMPTTANGFTQQQLAAIRKAREQSARDGIRYVGDYR